MSDDKRNPPPTPHHGGLPEGLGPEEEYEEEFELEIRTQKGSSIKVETTSYNKLDELLNKAFNTYQRLSKEESGDVDEKQQYQ